jgi:hypothetical protein
VVGHGAHEQASSPASEEHRGNASKDAEEEGLGSQCITRYHNMEPRGTGATWACTQGKSEALHRPKG